MEYPKKKLNPNDKRPKQCWAIWIFGSKYGVIHKFELVHSSKMWSNWRRFRCFIKLHCDLELEEWIALLLFCFFDTKIQSWPYVLWGLRRELSWAYYIFKLDCNSCLCVMHSTILMIRWFLITYVNEVII